MVKFKPLHNNVLVERIEQEQKTAGGILIPDSAKEKPITGKIISVGNGLTLDNGSVQAMSVKVGDTVLFNKWSGTEIKLEGSEYLIMKETDILGIVG
jgi:chaperonin GroES